MTPQELLTVAQAAVLCNVSEDTIRRDIELGHLLPSFKTTALFRTRYLMTQEDVTAYKTWRNDTYSEEFNQVYGRHPRYAQTTARSLHGKAKICAHRSLEHTAVKHPRNGE